MCYSTYKNNTKQKMPNSLPERVHTDAIALINTVYAFIPQQYHKKIEFSFQIFDNEQLKKKEG